MPSIRPTLKALRPLPMFDAARLIAALSAFVLCVSLSAGSALADAPQLLGQFEKWGAYTFGSGKSRICYVLAEPTEMQPSNVKRGDVYFMVTHRPAEKVMGEISTRIGYPFGDKSRPSARIGNARFTMFTGASQGGESAHWAWLEDEAKEDVMIRAMKKGLTMTVTGTSARGTETTDTYSLSGVTAALNRIDEECK